MASPWEDDDYCSCLTAQTVDGNPWIQGRMVSRGADGEVISSGPHPKQREFLRRYDREVMFGGAGAGGKSIALLAAAAQFVTVPSYSALILRRSYADLALPGALIHRSHEWWDGSDATWDGQGHKWTFPSGAIVQFGYLSDRAAEMRYRSAEFHFIAFDELTEFEEHQYLFLFSRLRRTITSQVPLRMRSATNPGGRGHIWAKTRFVDVPGHPKFIPARLFDNPSADQKEYEASLQNLDPVTRRQILEGDWEAYQGGRFSRNWLRWFTQIGENWRCGGRAFSEVDVVQRFVTVDSATTVERFGENRSDPDYTVASAWALLRCGYLLWLGCRRDRVEMPDIAPLVADVYHRYRCTKVIAEAGGIQAGVAQLLRREQLANGGWMNVVEYVPSGKGSKLVRAAEFLCMAEAGRLWLPENDYLFPTGEVVGELVLFTGDDKLDAHDDIMDTAAMAGQEASGQIEECQAMPMGILTPVAIR